MPGISTCKFSCPCGDTEVIVMDVEMGGGVLPDHVGSALQSLRHSVTALMEMIDEAMDLNKAVADYTLDNCFRCLSLRQWGPSGPSDDALEMFKRLVAEKVLMFVEHQFKREAETH